MTFSNLEPGVYTLRIIARNDKDDRTAVSRRLYISNSAHCAVHLINSGLSVYGDNAKVEFATTGLPVTGVRCTVDSREFPCKLLSFMYSSYMSTVAIIHQSVYV